MIRTVKKSRAVLAKRRAWRKVKGHTVTRKDERELLSAAEAVYREGIRERVWARNANCDLCGRPFEFELMGDLHEDPRRSQTMGLPKEQRFSVEICARAHRLPCHQLVTDRVWRVVFDDPILRFQGSYTVRHGQTDRPLFRMEARGGKS